MESTVIKGYKDLRVWQKAMDLVDKIYLATRAFPKEETYGLNSQMRRAAVSVPSNIAEGSARLNKKETIQFFNIARSSLAELETQVIIAQRINYISQIQYNEMAEYIDHISRMLLKMIQATR